MKNLLACTIMLSFFSVTFAQAAQTDTPKYSADKASKEYKQKVDVANGKLKKMEDRLAKIEKSQAFSKEDMDSMNTELDQYVENINGLYNEAVNRVKQAADSKGTQGGNEEFLYFEDAAQGQAARMKALSTKHNRIDNDIKNGKIKPTKETMDKMTPQEKKEFKNDLTPEGRKAIEKAYPQMTGIFIPSLPGKHEALVVGDMCKDASKKLADFLVSPAEGSVAIGCYGLCAVTVGAGCVACVLGAGPAAYEAYKTWISCKGTCSCTWYRFWCCARKTACAALLVAAIA